MPVSKKRTTSTAEAVKVESSDHKMPDEQEFRQRMRSLAVSAMRALIEAVMREELEKCVGAEWGECTPERKGYRNGSYTRDLVTSTGRIEDLSVPRDRAGQFHTQVFERYGRYESELFSRFGTAFSGDDFWKGMTSVGMQRASGSRLISLVSLFACSTLTITQLSGWCPNQRLKRNC